MDALFGYFSTKRTTVSITLQQEFASLSLLRRPHSWLTTRRLRRWSAAPLSADGAALPTYIVGRTGALPPMSMTKHFVKNALIDQSLKSGINVRDWVMGSSA
jgi:hypothetical protein